MVFGFLRSLFGASSAAKNDDSDEPAEDSSDAPPAEPASSPSAAKETRPGDAMFSEFSGAFSELDPDAPETEEVSKGATAKREKLIVTPKASKPAIAPNTSKQQKSGASSSDRTPQGYLFSCSDATLKDIEKYKVFGAPEHEFAQIEKCISPGTELMLFNMQSWKLMGPFVATGCPEKGLEKQAFQGKFTAQVHVAALEDTVREVQLQHRPKGGPKTLIEMNSLKVQLKRGNATKRTLEAWVGDATAQEPAAKKQRLSSSGPQIQAAAKPAVSKPGLQAARPVGKMAPNVAQLAAKGSGKSASGSNFTPAAAKGNGKVASGSSPAKGSTPPKGNGKASPHGGMQNKGAGKHGSAQASGGGYIFACTSPTLKEIEKLQIFGAPDRELPQMKKCIVPGTELYLLNVQSWKLMGPFVAVGAPAMNIEQGAFGGKFTAHVRVAPLSIPVKEMEMQQRPPNGPKSAMEAAAIRTVLQKFGRNIQKTPMMYWQVDSSSGSQEPPPKRQRSSPPQPVETFDTGLEHRGASAASAASQALEINESVDMLQGVPGYVFICNNATQREVQELQIFGLPDRELVNMQRIIKPGTPLFLFNMQTNMLMGTFVAASPPGMKLVKGAFGGKFNAHVHVSSEWMIFQVKLDRRISAGPRSVKEVAALQEQLSQGALADGQVQEDTSEAVEAVESVEPSPDALPDDGSVLKVPVLNHRLRMLEPDMRKDFEDDLAKLKEENGVEVELLCSADLDEDSLLLRGEPQEVQSAHDWLQSILPFYDIEINE